MLQLPLLTSKNIPVNNRNGSLQYCHSVTTKEFSRYIVPSATLRLPVQISWMQTYNSFPSINGSYKIPYGNHTLPIYMDHHTDCLVYKAKKFNIKAGRALLLIISLLFSWEFFLRSANRKSTGKLWFPNRQRCPFPVKSREIRSCDALHFKKLKSARGRNPQHGWSSRN